MIETKRLLIRVGTEKDYQSSKSIWTDPEVRKFSGGPATEDQFRKAFYDDLKKVQGDYGFKSVIEKSTNEHIGDCGLVEKEIDSKSEVEVIYFFAKSYWGNGFATEAAQAIIKFGFEKLGLNRIVALIHPDNTASEGVATRIGMSFEKNVITQSGNPRRLYSITK